MPTSKKGLGRGFESLIPMDLLDESFDPTAAQDEQVSELRQIKLDQITADPDQPRRSFEQNSLDELADSIVEHGVLQPIVVTPFKGGYQIVAGERRFRAAKIAGLDKIPALIRTISGQHKLEVSLIENLQRSDLNPFETATAYMKLRDQFNMTLEQIGKRVGNRSVSGVSNTLRLLRLPDDARDALIAGKITEGQARPLVGLDKQTVSEILPLIIRDEWSARKIEQFTVDLKKQGKPTAKTPKSMVTNIHQPVVDKIKKRLGTEVTISTNTRGQGKLVIKFSSDKEFERIQKLLSE